MPEKATYLVATNCTVDLPSAICEGFVNARTALRTLLAEALELRLQPLKEWPQDRLVRVSLYLATDVETRTRRLADDLGQPLEKVIAGLAYVRSVQRRLDAPTSPAAHSEQERHRGRSDAVGSSSLVAKEGSLQAPDERNALQTRLFLPLMSGLNNGKIVFAEGGTGLGKSRIIARSALEYLRAKPEAKVLVLAPTVSVLSHLVREFRQVVPSNFHGSSIVLGRGQFVSCKRLEFLLSSPPPDPALESTWQIAAEWFANGGKPLAQPEHRLTHEFSLCWLAEELRRAAPTFPVDDVLLGAEDEGDTADPAQLVYQALRLRAFDRDVKIVFATQSMACLNIWSYLRPDRQKGILPPCDLLLIDEAHELEEVMARTIGSSISLLHMRQVLRQGFEHALWSKLHLTTVAGELLTYLDQAEHVLRQIPNAGLISAWNANEEDNRQQTFTKFLKIARGLDAVLEPFTTVKATEDTGKLPIKLFREWHLAFRQMIGGRQNVWVEFSPVVRTPRLTVGPSQLIRPFEELWASCAAAGLLSGTLYLPNGDGRLSSGFLRMKLLVPRERAQEINPVHPSWNFTIPTVHLPDESAARTLLYPGSADDEHGADDVGKWHHALAARLLDISNTAAGGTLVLCCSYLDVRALSVLLGQKLEGRLLASRGGGSMRMLSEEFIQSGRRNMRPLWLATGSAWTGLDLSDHKAVDPAKDLALTDLVITRIPFGANKTAVHLARTKRLGFDVECMEAALRLKQGLGRLIRRTGVSQRRIWILDGRSHVKHSGYFRRVFGPVFAYPNRELFK